VALVFIGPVDPVEPVGYAVDPEVDPAAAEPIVVFTYIIVWFTSHPDLKTEIPNKALRRARLTFHSWAG